jgi:uncharacterized membrane protein
MKRFVLLLLVLVTNVLYTFAQDVRFKVSAPNVVEVGETFRLVYSLNKKGNGIKLGDIKGFQVLMGPSVSNSYSTQIINGKRTSKSEQSFSYVLSAVKEGMYTIVPAYIRVDGKSIASNSIKIEVVKAQSSSSNNKGSKKDVRKSKHISKDNLFVKIELDKKSIYMGEYAVASLKLYSRLGFNQDNEASISNFGRSKFPSFQGFLSQNIDIPERVDFNRENVNGEIFKVGILRQLVLFPQHSGKITIDPFELEIYVRQRAASSGSAFDDFFANYNEVKIKRESKPIVVHVKALPLKNQPSSFLGSVGHFRMKSSINRDTVIANDAVSLKVKITGNGNLKLIEPLGIDFPADFEIYDPKSSQNIRSSVKGTTGSVTFEYVFIPRSAGQYTIPSSEFSFFDVKTRKYKILKTKPFIVNVKKGKELASSGDVITSFAKEDIKLIGKDIRYIKTKNTSLYEKGVYVFGTISYYMSFIVLLFMFFLIMFLNKRRIKNNSDIARVKNKRASKIAKKRLRLAEAKMKSGDKDAFYDEILKAIWGFTSDKLNIPISTLSKENISEVLSNRKIDKLIISEYLNILDTCEYARYSPAASNSELNELYEKVSNLLTKLS